ncbi:MAG: phosphopyruvate hydratase [Candidatus Thalassarchaeaceae archaeon]|jgi:enolase|tara:strand:+ start:15250 stop:16497 length:1248 start_codon:yes stop_codon:yes gene_type:complete
MGSPISDLHGRMILDSRGNPTVEVECYASIDIPSRSTVPSGASTGSYEAVELRDGGKDWVGKGVDLAIENINGKIKEALIGIDVSEQNTIDQIMIELDNTSNKSNLGANAILGVSLACLRAAAGVGYPLWSHISSEEECSLPVPLMNILNGGAHANSEVDVQEFMIVPHGFTNFKDALRAGVEIYHTLKTVLKENQLLTGVGDEGGFAPNLPCNEDGLIYVVQAIESAGYKPGKQVSIALDVAAQEFLEGDKYHFDGKLISGIELANIYSNWIEKYPIVSIEDPFGEDDWDSWIEFTKKEGNNIQIVGDDLYVTNPERLIRGIEKSASNAILIKLNQIGTFTETMNVIKMAKDAGFATIISHRSGETSDEIISDIAVGTNAGQIKTGAPARSDRTSKYNQLLRISEVCENYSQLF